MHLQYFTLIISSLAQSIVSIAQCVSTAQCFHRTMFPTAPTFLSKFHMQVYKWQYKSTMVCVVKHCLYGRGQVLNGDIHVCCSALFCIVAAGSDSHWLSPIPNIGLWEHGDDPHKEAASCSWFRTVPQFCSLLPLHDTSLSKQRATYQNISHSLLFFYLTKNNNQRVIFYKTGYYGSKE